MRRAPPPFFCTVSARARPGLATKGSFPKANAHAQISKHMVSGATITVQSKMSDEEESKKRVEEKDSDEDEVEEEEDDDEEEESEEEGDSDSEFDDPPGYVDEITDEGAIYV